MSRIYFNREHQEVEGNDQLDLREIALENGVELYSGLHRLLNCRGRGLCGTCKVRVTPQSVLSEATKAETMKIPATDETVRLACQTFAFDNCEVRTFPRVRQAWMDHPCYQHLVEE